MVDSNGPLEVLCAEHRTMRTILRAMRDLVRERERRGAIVDTRAFRAMLYYLDVFPERIHHPKEERHLFALLRHRSQEADEVLDELTREHAAGRSVIRELEQALMRYVEGGEAEYARFAERVELFVEGCLEHIRKEEDIVMPCARKNLTAQDWAQIEAAFAEDADPLADMVAGTDFEQLRARIVALAPAPIGLGPAGPEGNLTR